MKKAFVLILAICLLSPIVVLAATPKRGSVTNVIVNGLIIRVSPTSKSDRASWDVKMWAGDTFDIEAVSGNWFKTTFKGVTGWVYSGNGYVDIIEYADDEDTNNPNKLPRLKRSAKKVKIKKMKPTEKNYSGTVVDIVATSDAESIF